MSENNETAPESAPPIPAEEAAALAEAAGVAFVEDDGDTVRVVGSTMPIANAEQVTTGPTNPGDVTIAQTYPTPYNAYVSDGAYVTAKNPLAPDRKFGHS